MSIKADDLMISDTDTRTASDALRDLQETLKDIVSTDGLSILPSEAPVAPREAGLHPLSNIPLAQARRKLNNALDALKNSAQARETWEDNKAERLVRVKNDAVAKSRAVRASKAALAECRRMALTDDPFATRAALALQRLRAVAEKTGATTDKTMEGADVGLLVCGSKFLADFTFADIRGKEIKVNVKFRFLTENDKEIPDEAVSNSFARLVEKEEFDVLKTSFQRLIALEKLNASTPGVSLIESLRAFEEDLLGAQELENKDGVTEAQRITYGHGAISRTAQGLRIRFTQKHAATLGVEDAASPVAISVGRSQLFMKDMSDGPVPSMQFSDMKTATVPACYVLRFEEPIIVCLTVAQTLERVGGPEKGVRQTVVKASGAGRELFNREKEEEKPQWSSLQKLLAPEVFDTGRRAHWSLSSSEFLASVKLGDEYIEFSHSGNDMINGVAITRVPICNPQNVKPVLASIRQQLVFNRLFRSCFGEPSEVDGLTALLKQPVEVVLYDSPGFLLFSLYDTTVNDIVSLAVSIAPGGEIEVTLKTSDGRPQACSNAKATAILKTCLSIPLTIATIVKIGSDNEVAQAEQE